MCPALASTVMIDWLPLGIQRIQIWLRLMHEPFAHLYLSPCDGRIFLQVENLHDELEHTVYFYGVYTGYMVSGLNM